MLSPRPLQAIVMRDDVTQISKRYQFLSVTIEYDRTMLAWDQFYAPLQSEIGARNLRGIRLSALSDFKIVVVVMHIVGVMMFDERPTSLSNTYCTGFRRKQNMPPGAIFRMSSH